MRLPSGIRSRRILSSLADVFSVIRPAARTVVSAVNCLGSASAILRGGTSLCDEFNSFGVTFGRRALHALHLIELRFGVASFVRDAGNPCPVVGVLQGAEANQQAREN